jgi:hypothetical protein
VTRMVLANQGGHVLGEQPVTAVGKGDDRGLAAVHAGDRIQARQAGRLVLATAKTLSIRRLRPPSRAARGRTVRQTTPRLLLLQPACAASPPLLPASETANSSLTPEPNYSFALPNWILASWTYPP